MVHTEHKHVNVRGAGRHIGEQNSDNHSTWKQQVVWMGRGLKSTYRGAQECKCECEILPYWRVK
jgi:hypothetical protein